MITVFNRKEVLVTYKMEEQAKARTVLSDHGVAYIVNVKNMMSPSPMAAGVRSRAGSFGVNQERMYEYKIYVHKKDYEQAVYLLNKKAED